MTRIALVLLALAPAQSAPNPVRRPDKVFSSHEDLAHPKFEEFRRKYGLEEAVKGESDEFKRILLLRHWLYRRVVVDKSRPATPEPDAVRTLEEGPGGGAYHCGHMCVALNPVLNSMGHLSRIVFAGAGEKEPRQLSGSHGANEVWSSALSKWILVDAEHDSHFEKEGAPLSALEVRDEVWRDGARNVARVKGQERRPQPRVEDESWGMTARTYAWVSWTSEGDRFTRYPERSYPWELVWEDEVWRTRTWHRDGKKHWAYGAGRFKPVPEREAIEWTPYVLDVKCDVKGDSAEVRIASSSPNLREYQVRRAGGAWERAEEKFTLKLGAAREEVLLRAVNAMGLPGPEHRLTVERR